MLHIWYGIDGQQNSDRALERICEAAKVGQTGQILLVPEQFSFDAEWRLCERGGDTISRFAEVLSFTRLYDRVCTLTGGAAEQIMDRAGRLIAMAGALEQVRSRLKIYGAHTAQPEFLLHLLALYEEFRSYGVDEQALETAQSALEGQLAEKLAELQLMFESYESVCANAAHDPAMRLTRLADKLFESEFAHGRQVYIDGFTDFTAQELDVIRALLQTGAEVTVCLCCDNLHSGQSVFSVTRQTARQLRGLADADETWPVAAGEKQPAFAHLRDWLFRSQTPVFSGETPLALLQATTPSEQAQALLAQMQLLVRRGVSWRQIAVACTDLPQFQPILERLFVRYRIPHYLAGSKALPQTPVACMLLSALRAASGRMEAEDVLDYCKSGFAPLSGDESDALENYALVWGLQGAQWAKPFTRDPSGYDKSADAQERLAELNRAREAAIVPLCRLREALAAAKNTGEQILALDAFLQSIRLAERLSEMTNALQEAGEFRRAQQTAQIYDGILDTMEQIYGVLGGTVRTPEEFCQFFRAALSQNSVGTIPATLDCVRVGSLRDLRNSRAPYLFVLGASEGLLPMCAPQTGLLTGTERRWLQNAGLTLAPDRDAQLERELLTVYTVLNSCSEGLYLSCQTEEPSYLFTRVQKLFPRVGMLPRKPLPATLSQAAAQFKDALPRDPALAQTAEILRSRAGYQTGTLQPQNVRELYGRTARLSASKVDKLASCRLAFFLDYGLGTMQRREAQIDDRRFGTFVHAVLEKTARRVMEEGGFCRVSAERVRKIAEEAIDDYVRSELQGLSEKPEREQYLFRRNFEEVLTIADDMAAELRDSDFVPSAFELHFADRNAVRIEGKLSSALMTGYVDRVDLYTAPNGEEFVRVVDYKTGTKLFDYTDILSGLNLQMLIYLFALQEHGKALLGTDVTGAGVLYFPAKVDVLSDAHRLTEEAAAKNRAEEFRRKGLLLSDPAILRAMEHTDPPVYLPCKSTGKNKYLADREQFAMLERVVTQTLGELTDELYGGDLTPHPWQRGDKTPCKYCEYRRVCHVASGAVERRDLSETDEKRFWQEIERRDGQHG